MGVLQVPAESVIVGVDGSEQSDRALAWAADQARYEGRPLVIVHALGAVDPYWMVQPVVDVQALKDSMVDGAQQLLGAARDAVLAAHPDLQVSVAWKSEDARHLLIEASAEAAMVVVGSHGHGRFKRLLLGSVSVGVTRHAHCPVAVVRPDAGATGGGGVLVGVDGTPESLPTLDQAFRMAASRGAPLTVVHCFLDGGSHPHEAIVIDPDDQEHGALRSAVAETLAAFRPAYPSVEPAVVLVRGLADDILLELALGMDVAVVGTRERSTLTDLVLGSVAGTLVERAPCTVVVVPRS